MRIAKPMDLNPVEVDEAMEQEARVVAVIPHGVEVRPRDRNLSADDNRHSISNTIRKMTIPGLVAGRLLFKR